MPESTHVLLIVAAGLNAVASLLHVVIIVGGAPWYRFFGAGERFTRAAESGKWWPHAITLGIAAVLALWAVYALSGAGILPALPWRKEVLIAITAIYAIRGLALFPALLLARHMITPFVIGSSIICMGYGAVHLLGLVDAWPELAGIRSSGQPTSVA